MKALIVIDFTVDFVNGSLPVGEPAVAIEDRICELTRSFVDQKEFVVMAVDLHHENDPFHPETRLFPPHNIKGSAGRGLFGKLQDVYEQHKDRIYWMDKTRYSAFSGTDLELQLRSRQITELHLIGVCTDICVLHTAVDAYNKGFQVVVHADAVASFDQAGHEWSLRHVESTLGGQVTGK
ncbi:cysteine hydrolase family protein [Marinicrinis sediminis]|uniref:Cysteine hydrolase family protein n=1 Tax=Marinicrinis sediminis TaxID=1652465 RepID=A0ABW5REP8_9BACL